MTRKKSIFQCPQRFYLVFGVKDPRRNERQRKELEDTIDSLETEVKEIQEDMCKPANLSDSKALRELQEKLDSAQEELDFVYDKWLNL